MPARSESPPQTLTGVLVIEAGKGDRAGEAFYAAKWRASLDGRQVKRRLGPAWLERADEGGWRPRRGRLREGFLDERRAHAAMAEQIARGEAEDATREDIAAERERAGQTFRGLAAAWLADAEHVRRVKPSTLRDHQSVLAEPGTPYRGGRSGLLKGRVMSALGDMPACEVSARDIDKVLKRLAAEGAAARTVNKHREVLRAIFNYGMSASSEFGLTSNPAAQSQRRREDAQRRLEVFSVEQVEELARSAARGEWRESSDWARDEKTAARYRAEDAQLGELLRIACYTGLRRGELVALRWSDVRWDERVLIVERALSGEIETPPKSGRVRYVPLADQALAALDRLSRREHFTGPKDYVFASAAGDRLDPSALRRRYVAARDAAGLPALRFHDLRHTAGSLLVRVIDPASVKDILGHADLKTTERYLHSQRASLLADAATQAFAPAAASDEKDRAHRALEFALAELEPDEITALLAQRAV